MAKKYHPFGEEWEKEMMKLPKKELVLRLKVKYKADQISTIEDAEGYIRGCLNDFESGLSTKEETLGYFGEYTNRLMSLFWEKAKKKIKKHPELLNE